MDPVANLNRQREIVSLITEALDEPVGTVEGFIDTDSRNEVLAEHASELAELVQALDEWRRKGGFDPYGAVSD